MPPKKIHVLKGNIHVEGQPVFAVITFEGTTHGFRELEISGPSKLVCVPKEEYDCACGPRIWLETEAAVTIDGKILP